MAKRKNTTELLAERNPLQRALVEPVDIYDQGPSDRDGQESRSSAARKPVGKKEPKANTDDPLRPYSTYLRRSQVKNVKRHAVEREVKDMLIMQEAVDEYLKRHTL